MEKLQRFNNFKRINESATIDDAKLAIKDVFRKKGGEVTKTYLKKVWEEEKTLRDLYGMDLFYKAWDELIDQEEIKTEDGVKFCWCDMTEDNINESLTKEDEEKYLSAKQRKLPEGLKKAIIKRAKKAKKSEKKNESFVSINEDISKEDEEKYLTPKQRKLPEGLKKSIIKRAKKAKKSEKKNESVHHQKGHSEIADAVRMYLSDDDIELVCKHDDIKDGDPIEILNDTLGIKSKYIVELIEDGIVDGNYAITYICSLG
ncbi:MAG: hypothetical protein ACOC3V_01065 [bacterium]